MSHTKKIAHSIKNVSQWEKWVTIKKRVTILKMAHTWKNVSQLEKTLTLTKCVTIGKMGHTC